VVTTGDGSIVRLLLRSRGVTVRRRSRAVNCQEAVTGVLQLDG
jgi:hypothetical protein